jgi:repressor LexA
MMKATAGETMAAASGLGADDTDASAETPGRRRRRTPVTEDFELAEVPDRPHSKPNHVLTRRQRKVLQTIEWFAQCRGYPPTLREIAEAVGLASASSVAYQLSCLQDMGYLSRDEGRPRTAVIRADGQVQREADEAATGAAPLEAAYVPFVGRIAAGDPILAEQSLEDTYPLPRQLVGEGKLLLLRVCGDSMIDAAIFDGDWVVVREQPVAENGEIVAAMIEGEATVKTLKRSDGHVWLMPANPRYEPIPGDRATIVGKAVAVLRRL